METGSARRVFLTVKNTTGSMMATSVNKALKNITCTKIYITHQFTINTNSNLFNTLYSGQPPRSTFVYCIAGVNLRHASLFHENVNLYRIISYFFINISFLKVWFAEKPFRAKIFVDPIWDSAPRLSQVSMKIFSKILRAYPAGDLRSQRLKNLSNEERTRRHMLIKYKRPFL